MRGQGSSACNSETNRPLMFILNDTIPMGVGLVFDESDIPAKPMPNRKDRRVKMAKGKPSKGTGKDKRLKRNRGKKKRK